MNAEQVKIIKDALASVRFQMPSKSLQPTPEYSANIAAEDALDSMVKEHAALPALEHALKTCPALNFSEPILNNWWVQTANPALKILKTVQTK